MPTNRKFGLSDLHKVKVMTEEDVLTFSEQELYIPTDEEIPIILSEQELIWINGLVEEDGLKI